MAVNAPQVVFKQEIINAFDKTQSILRDTVTTEFMEKGGSAVFLVSDGSATAATQRGANGLIPARNLNLTQNTATLAEYNDLVQVNGFNIFQSQGDLNLPMHKEVMATVNREIDKQIQTILATGTVNTGAAVAGSTELLGKALTMLGNRKVPNDGNVTALVTPAFAEYLRRSESFSSADYVQARPFVDGMPAFGDMRMMYKWAGMNIIVDPTLSGVGTAAAKCFLYHKNSIGQAISKNSIDAVTGFDQEQNYSWARATVFMGTTKLQDSGIIVINHNDLALSA